MSDVRLFRWAPTPSGPLHIGNVFSFLLTWLLARQKGGEILLRIDDLDSTRSRPQNVEDIFRVLGRLGLEWQQGPQGPGDFASKWSQGLRQDLYREGFMKMQLENPSRFFVCECSRSKVAALGTSSVYPGTCRDLGLKYESGRLWRCRVPQGDLRSWSDGFEGRVSVDVSREMGDFVIFRREQIFSYQWVSLFEDLHYGVTDVVRGSDLINSTAAQLYLGQGTAFERCRFWHHPLVKGRQGKLSKSEGAQSAWAILEGDDGIRRVCVAFAKWCGWGDSEDMSRPEDLWEAFSEGKGREFCFERAKSIEELL